MKSTRYEIVFPPAAGIPALYITLMRFKGAIGLAGPEIRTRLGWGCFVSFCFVFNV